MRHIVGRVALVLTAVMLPVAGGAAMAAGSPFPDVPPWHWANDSVTTLQGAGIVIGYPASPEALSANSVTQVYDAFVHSGSPGAQAWAERFTYDRPATWPAPFQRAEAVAFSLTRLRAAVTGDTAMATYDAAVTLRDGRRAAGSMRVRLRLSAGGWQVDYATLAGGSPLFR